MTIRNALSLCRPLLSFFFGTCTALRAVIRPWYWALPCVFAALRVPNPLPYTRPLVECIFFSLNSEMTYRFAVPCAPFLFFILVPLRAVIGSIGPKHWLASLAAPRVSLLLTLQTVPITFALQTVSLPWSHFKPSPYPPCPSNRLLTLLALQTASLPSLPFTPFTPQSALLYTSTSGQRRVRCHTLGIPVTGAVETLFRSAGEALVHDF